jgi:hypothetical protein
MNMTHLLAMQPIIAMRIAATGSSESHKVLSTSLTQSGEHIEHAVAAERVKLDNEVAKDWLDS